MCHRGTLLLTLLPSQRRSGNVWGHHIMVGEGTRPLKQDYCIASDSHFVGEKRSQCVSVVRASRNRSSRSTPHAAPCILFRLMSESMISNSNTLEPGLMESRVVLNLRNFVVLFVRAEIFKTVFLCTLNCLSPANLKSSSF